MGFQDFIGYLISADAYQKNSIIYIADNNLYDMDTTISIPNFNPNVDSYWDDKNGYCDYVYDIMYTSTKYFGPRGEYYNLVLVKDNKIIAFGDEQGNYAGGIYCANDFNYNRFINEIKYIKNQFPELYDQIKDFPIAKENEYPRYIKN
jgi:hypothetical protein